MSSRFVPAGTAQATTNTTDEWDKARQQIESQQTAKRVEPGTQDGGRSLYEVLQANKAAKQEAFEEATKLRNQFRALDDSDVEFLDSIRESERAKEKSVQQETKEQLELFRKQQIAVGQAATSLDDNTQVATELVSNAGSWHTSRKRRRDKGDEGTDMNKPKKVSPDQLTESVAATTPAANEATDNTNATESESGLNTSAVHKRMGNQMTKKAGNFNLGLSAYSSDADSDDEDDET